MRARLNLATKAVQTHRRFFFGASVVSAVAGIVFLILGWHVYSVRKLDSQVRTQSEDLQKQQAQLDAQKKALNDFFNRTENAKLNSRAAFLNSVIDARSFDWTAMFMDLEHVMPAGVRVVSIEPRQIRGHVEVRFTVGAANDEVKLKFLRALESSKEFSDVELEREQTSLHPESGEQKVIELKAQYSRIG